MIAVFSKPILRYIERSPVERPATPRELVTNAQSTIDKTHKISPSNTASTLSSRGYSSDNTSVATSYVPDAHTVSEKEAIFYYAGLYSRPTLLYRTGKKWAPPTGPEAYPILKKLCEVFGHPITKVWNDDLSWKVVEIMDAHKIRFSTIDVVRFEKVNAYELAERIPGPVTIWIGVHPGSTSATAAHNAAQDVLALLKDYNITDVDVDFRESVYRRQAGPRLLDPVDEEDQLFEVVGPLTHALGLGISTTARPDAQGTMALYLAEGGDSDKLLGLSCRHVLIEPEGNDIDYVGHPSGPRTDVILPGDRGFANLVSSIETRIQRHGYTTEHCRGIIKQLEDRENGTDAVDVEKAKATRLECQESLDSAEKATGALSAFLDRINTDWKNLDDRVIGHILCSPAIRLGVGEQRLTEDWAVFQVDRAKLGSNFRGNVMDFGVLEYMQLMKKCLLHEESGCDFDYPIDRLLPLSGTITEDLMRNTDMRSMDGKTCLLVIKNGSATGTTIGRASGAFSIVRDYSDDMSAHQTSLEWAIFSYDNKEPFSKPGDSGAIIADISGRVGGMITGGSGCGETPDITYATPFWWLLERIRANGFPNVHLDVA